MNWTPDEYSGVTGIDFKIDKPPLKIQNQPMTTEELKHLKESLEKEKAELEKDIALNPTTVDMGSDVEGEEWAEEAEEAEAEFTNAAMREPLKERLESVKMALDRLERGEYGKCVSCGQDIPLSHLENNPKTKHCQGCNPDQHHSY